MKVLLLLADALGISLNVEIDNLKYNIIYLFTRNS